MTISVLGFVSRDIISCSGKETAYKTVGGKAYYSSLCFSALGNEVAVFTYGSASDRTVFASLARLNPTIFPGEVPVFENYYPKQGSDVCLRKAVLPVPFRFSAGLFSRSQQELLQGSAAIHLGPAHPDEMNADFLRFIRSTYTARISADMDYFLKTIQPDGTTFPAPREQVWEQLASLDVVLLSYADVPFCGNSPEEAARWISEAGPKEVVITQGSQGARIYHRPENKWYTIPAVAPSSIVDVTGAGDTFIAAYVHARQTMNIEEAGHFAASTTARKIAFRGALSLIH